MKSEHMNELSKDDEYIAFLKIIKSEIQTARIQVAKTVNRELISLYWKIGEIIVERQKELGWGKSVVEQLSQDICKEFDGLTGFSADNLWRMRQFYLEYSNKTILEQAVPELYKARKHKKFLEQLVPDLLENNSTEVKSLISWGSQHQFLSGNWKTAWLKKFGTLLSNLVRVLLLSAISIKSRRNIENILLICFFITEN
jgi:hypothetical protein